jgi:hypothetical protein
MKTFIMISQVLLFGECYKVETQVIKKNKIQGVSKRDLQLYSNCYCVASVMKTFTLKDIQTINHSAPW